MLDDYSTSTSVRGLKCIEHLVHICTLGYKRETMLEECHVQEQLSDLAFIKHSLKGHEDL